MGARPNTPEEETLLYDLFFDVPENRRACLRPLIDNNRPTGQRFEQMISYAAQVQQIKEWCAEHMVAGSFTVRDCGYGIVLIEFDRDADLIFFKMRWYG